MKGQQQSQYPTDVVDRYRDSLKGGQLTTNPRNSRYQDNVELCERGDDGHRNCHWKPRRGLLFLSLSLIFLLGVSVMRFFAYSCTSRVTLVFSGGAAGVVKRDFEFEPPQKSDPFQKFNVIFIIIAIFIPISILGTMYKRGDVCFQRRQPMQHGGSKATSAPGAIVDAGAAPGFTGDTSGPAGGTPGHTGDPPGFSPGGGGGGDVVYCVPRRIDVTRLPNQTISSNDQPPEHYTCTSSQLQPPIMRRAPPSHVKRPKPYGRPMAPSSKTSGRGDFYKAQNFTIQDSIFCDPPYNLEPFMEKLAVKTIPGAASDSSERDPPPRCHPGTRLVIVARTLRFFTDRESNKRFLWIVGPAGVGKSAIMQTLAETPPTPNFTLGASLFFSVNGRDNGLQAIVTLAYQLAVKSESYKDFIQRELAKDPMLLDKALAPQFNKFIIEPFAVQRISPDGHERFLILIDGLDECNSHDTQRTILDLISSFCIEYPAAPLVWVVASRPEPHITRFLSLPNIISSYITEQIEVDNDESREDVERYLRNGLENIRTKYPALDHFPRWPAEHDFTKLATAAGGLFAFGKTVVDYIDDPMYANPASQLKEVLEVIGEIRSREGEGKKHPMADLDALYSRIVSKIPRDVLNDTKKLLLFIISPPGNVSSTLPFCCDWLGIPIAAAYAALHHLHSVLDIPSVSAPSKTLEFRHKSFYDYLTDYARSGLFPNVDDEVHETHIRCATRILGGASKARDNRLDPYDGILLSWPPLIEQRKANMRFQYVSAIQFVTAELRHLRSCYCPDILSALRFIDIQFCCRIGFDRFDFSRLASGIFGDVSRPELEKLNAFQKVPIGMFDKGKVSDWMDIIVSCRSEPCDLVPAYPPCALGVSHGVLAEELGISGDENRWIDSCGLGNDCDCAADFLQKLETRKTHSPGDILTIFTDSTGNRGWIHHTFTDSEYPLSTWEFIIPYEFEPTVAIVEPT